MYERNTPNISMVNLYMLIFPTPLCLIKVVHIENTVADMNPR